MTNSNLIFEESYTVTQFKALQNCRELAVFNNPETGCLFFTFGPGKGHCGKVSKQPLTAPIVSKCYDEASGETFWLLHNEGQGLTPIATF